MKFLQKKGIWQSEKDDYNIGLHNTRLLYFQSISW